GLAFGIGRGLAHRAAPVGERVVVAREQPCCRLADLRDAERVDEAVECYRAPLLDRGDQALDRFLAPALALLDLPGAAMEPEHVARGLEQAVGVEGLDVLPAQAFDVEAAARHEMAQPLDDLRLAGEAPGAAPRDLAFLAHRVRAAHRADFGELELAPAP